MKKVALLTTFFEVTSGYSLVGVAENQIRMLVDNGYEPIVLVDREFTEPPAPSIWRSEMLDLRPVVPKIDEPPEATCAMLEEQLTGVDVVIAHDIPFQDSYKKLNQGVIQYVNTHPGHLWLHWIHSCPMGSEYKLPSGYLIYPNESDRGLVCRAYKLHGQEWRVRICRAGHSIDPLLVWPYDRLTRDILAKFDLLAGDVAAIYPARLDRGKQVQKAIRLMAGVARAKREPRLLVVDWQSMGAKFQKYMDELLELADSLGLAGKVAFTSRLDDRCHNGVPRHVVQELMDLSNVYIHPSAVETYSLVVHEAILRGKLAVLNGDFPAMRELFGRTALYMDFGSDRINRTYEPDEQTFWNDQAVTLLAELDQNRALLAQSVARREWSPQAQWAAFQPLLYLQPVGAP